MEGRAPDRAFRVLMLLVCAWITLAAQFTQGFEAQWYQLHKVMAFCGDSPFQHRVLLVLLAKGFKSAAPTLSDTACFFLSQVPVMLLLFWVVELWARMHVGRGLSFIAQPLVALMLIPTFGYWTFYDAGIVLFFTAGLLCLFQGKLRLFCLLLGLGTLNHEIALYLIPLFVAVYWDRGMSRKRVLGLAALQLLLYVGVRGLLFLLMPATTAWQPGKLAFNLDLVLHHPAKLARSTGLEALVLWCGVACLGVPHAPKGLRRCLVLLPLVIVMVLLVGQLNETRLFDALIPVVLALCLYAIRERMGPSAAGGAYRVAGTASTANPRPDWWTKVGLWLRSSPLASG